MENSCVRMTKLQLLKLRSRPITKNCGRMDTIKFESHNQTNYTFSVVKSPN